MISFVSILIIMVLMAWKHQNHDICDWTEWKLQGAIILTAFVRQIWLALTHSTNINPLNAIIQIFLFFCLSHMCRRRQSDITCNENAKHLTPAAKHWVH